MNTAELKLHLFRQIDTLDELQLKIAYNQISVLLNSDSKIKNTMPEEVRKAIDAALDSRKPDSVITTKTAKRLTVQKFPHLFDLPNENR